MSYYIEDPLDRIVDVHWKKKPPEPPDPEVGSYCGRYGYGGMWVEIPGALVIAPYGPNLFIPFVGTFKTDVHDPVYGGLTAPKESMAEPVDTMTAYDSGLHATGINLLGNSMEFSNFQIQSIASKSGLVGQFRWTVPMATGRSADDKPMVIKTYTIKMDWLGIGLEGDFGIGISHRVPRSGPLQPPPEPAVFGSQAGGSLSYVYDFRYADWQQGNIPVNAGNQYDPKLGGPAFLWSMSRGPGGGAWGGSPIFGMTGGYVGSWYTWEIIGACQPQPPIILGA